MPTRALRICTHPGCRELAAGPRCPKHVTQKPAKLYDEQRGSAASRGYGRRHERWRKMVLARDPLCMIQKLCGRGLDRPSEAEHFPAVATVADHVKPLDRGVGD